MEKNEYEKEEHMFLNNLKLMVNNRQNIERETIN